MYKRLNIRFSLENSHLNTLAIYTKYELEAILLDLEA